MLRKHVYIHYSDGQYSLHLIGRERPIVIFIWQWWIWCAYRALDRPIHRWLCRLDNRAFAARDGESNNAS